MGSQMGSRRGLRGGTPGEGGRQDGDLDHIGGLPAPSMLQGDPVIHARARVKAQMEVWGTLLRVHTP